MAKPTLAPQKPTGAFIGASWAALLSGVIGYFVSLWNANSMELNEKGLYFAIIFSGLFAVVSVQKTIRDRAEDIPVTNIYYGLAWTAVIVSLGLLVVSLWNAELLLSEKGVYGYTMLLSLFAAIAVQKNVRDLAVFAEIEKAEAKSRPTPTPNPATGGAPANRPDLYGATAPAPRKNDAL